MERIKCLTYRGVPKPEAFLLLRSLEALLNRCIVADVIAQREINCPGLTVELVGDRA